MTERNMKDMSNHVHCAKHDIYFPKRLQEEADKANAELKASGWFAAPSFACPECRHEESVHLVSLICGTGNQRSQRDELVKGPRFHSGGKDEQYIWREADRTQKRPPKTRIAKT